MPITKKVPGPILCAYAIFITIALAVYHFVAEGEFSSLFTLASVVQCFGVAFLCIQVQTTGSAIGISAGAVTLDAFAFALRLSSTTWLQGYIPMDASGDHVYQWLDVCSLLMTLWLLRAVLVVYRRTYQEKEDSLNVGYILLTCLILACLLHGDLNSRPVFDTLWMTGLFSGVVAVIPQLRLIMNTGGRVPALTSHYIAALALSRVISGFFLWHAREEITCYEWIWEGFPHASWAVLSAQAIHLFLLVEFAYYYASALSHGTLDEVMVVKSWAPDCHTLDEEGGKWV